MATFNSNNVVDSWLAGLNPEQREAVLHDCGPQLILAGAGSGKTTVLVARTGRMLAEQKVKAKEVTVLTFTNKAARELKERVSHKIGRGARDIWAGTFHSFGLGVIRKHHKKAGLPKQFGIIDASDARAIVRDLLKDIHHFSKDGFDVEKLLSVMGEWRERGQTRAKTEDEYEEVAQMMLPRYLKKLELLGVVDFEGLLIKPLEIFERYPETLEFYHENIQQLMVDEFQDTNTIQMKLVNRLVESHKNITVVGDDDQSIYGWRGACVSNILDFPSRYEGCKVVRLERNYRSTPSILRLANTVIERNSQRHHKVLKASAYDHEGNKPEIFVYDTEEQEAEEAVHQIHHFLRQGYKHDDIAILYRSNSQGGLLEGSLRRSHIPYSLTGGSAFFDRREVKDVLAYLRCSVAPNEVAFRRIINTPHRGVGETTLKSLEEYSHEHNISLFRAAKRWGKVGLADKTGEKLESLFEVLEKLPERLVINSAKQTTGEKLLDIFREIGYRDLVFQHYKDTATAQKRWQLIEILGRVLDGFFEKGGRTLKTLKEFIDSMELRDVVEETAQQKEIAKVQLLTLHACKGLEFPVVLIVGLEEDILPHRTLGSDIDEERRLFYVGVTRAKEHLVMSRVRQRRRFGKLRPSAPSRFLLEVPEGLVETHEEGARPVSENERKSMMADLFKKLDQKRETNNESEK